MAEQFAPIAKDSSLNTTDLTPKNIADVLQDGLATLASSVKPTADEIPFDNTGTSLVSTDVEGAIKETAGVTYHQDLSNISVNIAWGSVFESGNNVPDFNVNGLNKRITVSFVPTSAASAIPFISAAGATRVAITLVRGTSGTVSGDLYITVYD